MSLTVPGEDIELRSYEAVPSGGIGLEGVVLSHGFPQAPREAASTGVQYSELADRIADQTELTVLTFNFRGTGQSQGDFGLGGWLEDLRTAVHYLRTQGVENVWLAGFGVGGSLSLCLAALDKQIAGVCSFSARAHFDDWADNADQLLVHARKWGLISDPDFPRDYNGWVQDMRDMRPIDSIESIPVETAVMIVHGADDDRVPVDDARSMAAASGGRVDLRIVHGAGHRLRHDPRAVALLLGWLDRRQ